MKSNPPDQHGTEGRGDGSALPDDLSAALESVRPRLGRLAATVVYFDTIGSTNDEAASRSAKAFALRANEDAPRGAKASAQRPEGLVVVAGEQTAGRGRRGHTWFSPPGSGLYVSVVLDFVFTWCGQWPRPTRVDHKSVGAELTLTQDHTARRTRAERPRLPLE